MHADDSSPDVSAAEVRAQRDRILASDVFSKSKRQCDFLDYVVNAALEGREDKLKEFVLGIDVFEKDNSFDPNIDSIVRVEASRLRGKLREYYVDQGQNDAVRIEIPKGHYVPVFKIVDRPEKERRALHPSYLWVALAITAISVALISIGNLVQNREGESSTAILPAPPHNSVAVLPLRDWSSSQEEYFSEAMTDALITSLAQLRSLRVTSLTSIMRYENTKVPVTEIGRTLGVAYIVEGSVFRDDQNLRITAQLIAADTDTHVWAKTFDRESSDLLLVQSEIAAEIATQISKELLPVSQSRVEQRNPAAREAFLKGRYFYNQFTADGFRRSMTYFQEAIDIEPYYAEAYAGLASCHCLLAGHGLELVSPVVAIPEAQTLARKALSLDPDLAEPVAFLGIINFKYEWDLEGAEAMLKRALEVNPSLFQAYVWHSQVLEAVGRHDDAIDRARYAKQLNPLSRATGLNLAWQMFQAGNYIEARMEVDKLIEFDPRFWGGHWALGHIHRQHQMYQKAIAEFQLAVDLGGGHSLPISALGYAYAIAGMADKARQVIAELEDLSQDIYVSPFHVATVYAGLNEPDLMFERLERAYKVRARSLAWLPVTKELKPFHDDPRFQDLLSRIGIYGKPNSQEIARLDR